MDQSLPRFASTQRSSFDSSIGPYFALCPEPPPPPPPLEGAANGGSLEDEAAIGMFAKWVSDSKAARLICCRRGGCSITIGCMGASLSEGRAVSGSMPMPRSSPRRASAVAKSFCRLATTHLSSFASTIRSKFLPDPDLSAGRTVSGSMPYARRS